MKTITLLSNVISLKGMGGNAEKEGLFPFGNIKKAVPSKEVTAEFDFGGYIEICHVGKVEKADSLNLSYIRGTTTSLILWEHKMGREEMDLRDFGEVKLTVLSN